MPKIPIIKAKDFYAHLVKYGCIAVSVRGSHHKMQNPATSKVSVIAIHGGKDVDKGAFSAVLSQLGINADDFIDFINKN